MLVWKGVYAVLVLVANNFSAQTAVDPAYAINIPLSDLVTKFQQMTVGQSLVATGVTKGTAVVIYIKLSDTTFRTVVYDGDPADPNTKAIYTNNYRWVASAKTLIGVQCSFTPPTTQPYIIMNCQRGLSFAVLLMQIVLRPPITSFDASGYRELVKCIEDKTSNIDSYMHRVCIINPLNDMVVAESILLEQQSESTIGPPEQWDQLISIARIKNTLDPSLVPDQGVL